MILRTRPLTETSLIVHWLTRDFGRISTVAKGARRGIDEAVQKGKIRPEFLNRLDAQVCFRVLTPEVMKEIARIQLKKKLTPLLNGQGYELKNGDDVVDYLARYGYDPVNGARPLRRLILARVHACHPFFAS